MTPVNPEGQLELFDLASQPAPRLRPEHVGRFLLQLRYDQLAVGCIACVLGLTVIFACGVERGKQLVRSERAMLAREQTGGWQPKRRVAATPSEADQVPAVTPVLKQETAEKIDGAEKKSTPPPALTPNKVKKPSKLASETPKPTAVRKQSTVRQVSRSRYAIQVVTYSEPHLAKQELDRLQARGERAFLIMREGRTNVYVGPFPSRDNASQKLTMLKTRYQDCFLRTL